MQNNASQLYLYYVLLRQALLKHLTEISHYRDILNNSCLLSGFISARGYFTPMKCLIFNIFCVYYRVFCL